MVGAAPCGRPRQGRHGACPYHKWYPIDYVLLVLHLIAQNLNPLVNDMDLLGGPSSLEKLL